MPEPSTPTPTATAPPATDAGAAPAGVEAPATDSTPPATPATEAAPEGGKGKGGGDTAALLKELKATNANQSAELRKLKSAAGRTDKVQTENEDLKSRFDRLESELEGERSSKRQRSNLDAIQAGAPATRQRLVRLLAVGLAAETGVDLTSADASTLVESMTKTLRDDKDFAEFFAEPKAATTTPNVPKHAAVSNGAGAPIQLVGLLDRNGERIA